jgi:ribonuclease III
VSETNLNTLQDLLGYRFRDESLLRLALTHPSVAHESPVNTPHNQRLEFLGDSVLGASLTSALYEKFPQLGEGPLTKARAQLVNRRTLAAASRRLRLGEHLLMSHGEDANGGRERTSALADVFEAVVGAIFLDGGYTAASEFVLRCFKESLSSTLGAPNLDNPKGELQELLQATSLTAPRYEMKVATGPDHDRVFESAVSHEGVELARGQGKSKKEAESAAATAALEKLRAIAPATPPHGA